MDRQEEFIKRFYDTKQNFKVEDNPRAEEPDLAVIYFSSMGLYSPKSCFRRLNSDYYEFHRNPIRRAGRHIYVRDVCQIFYLNGINAKCNSIEKIIKLLASLTKGYKIITLGISGGGYMAMLAGAKLGAKYVISESGMVDLSGYHDNFPQSPKWVNWKKDESFKYFDIFQLLKNSKTEVFQIEAAECQADHPNFHKMEKLPDVVFLNVKTAAHGGALDAPALGNLINLPETKLRLLFKKYQGKKVSRTGMNVELLSFRQLLSWYLKKTLKNFLKVKISRKEKILIFLGFVLYNTTQNKFQNKR